MARTSWSITTAVVCCFVTMPHVFVAGDYVLEVHVQSYNNPTSRAARNNGGCCDFSLNVFCDGGSRCDTYFSFCVRSFNTTSTDRGCTNTTAVTSRSVQDDRVIDFTQTSFLGLDNPLLLPGLTTAWQGAELYVEVIDRDRSSNNDDYIDSFSIDISSDQPVGTNITSGTPDGIFEGVHGYGRIGLTVRVLCAENYYGDRCQFLYEADQCQVFNITCSGQGTCIDGVNSYTCDCNHGYTGHDCEVNINECLEQNCSGNGQCVGGINSICDCYSGYTGTLCDDINDCVNVNCSGNGQCVDGDNNFNCICQPGYTGQSCEMNINDCQDENCTGHGNCQDLVNDYQCVCNPGYSGNDCVININDCQNENCAGQGNCQDLVNDYQCVCNLGYTGRDCEMNINDCEGQNCSGNGKCVDLVNSFNCVCDSGYTGTLCDDIDDCVNVNCSGNGQCLDGENNFTCICQSGFFGELCNTTVQGSESSSTIAGAVGGTLGGVVVLILIILLVLLTLALILKGKNNELVTQESPTDLQYEPGDNPIYGIADNKASTVLPTSSVVAMEDTSSTDPDLTIVEFDNPIYDDSESEASECEAPCTTNQP